jgi:hypothetical protein
MTTETKEFYEMMEMFEKTAKSIIRTGSQGYKRAPKELWTSRNYYLDGEVNQAFIMFSAGHSYGRLCFRD